MRSIKALPRGFWNRFYHEHLYLLFGQAFVCQNLIGNLMAILLPFGVGHAFFSGLLFALFAGLTMNLFGSRAFDLRTSRPAGQQGAHVRRRVVNVLSLREGDGGLNLGDRVALEESFQAPLEAHLLQLHAESLLLLSQPVRTLSRLHGKRGAEAEVGNGLYHLNNEPDLRELPASEWV